MCETAPAREPRNPTHSHPESPLCPALRCPSASRVCLGLPRFRGPACLIVAQTSLCGLASAHAEYFPRSSFSIDLQLFQMCIHPNPVQRMLRACAHYVQVFISDDFAQFRVQSQNFGL